MNRFRCFQHDFLTDRQEFYNDHLIIYHSMCFSLRHIGIVTNDLPRLQRFYERNFGFVKILERYESDDFFHQVNGTTQNANTVKIKSNNLVLELIEYEKKSGDPLGHTALNKMHFCLAVKDIHSVYEKLKPNAKIISPPIKSHDPAIVMTLLDPDENYIELVEITGEMPKGL